MVSSLRKSSKDAAFSYVLNFCKNEQTAASLLGLTTHEYKVAKHKLQQILQDAVNTFTPSKEIQELLEKYLPKEEDVNSEQDLSDLENLLGVGTEETQQFEEYTIDISGNLKEVH